MENVKEVIAKNLQELRREHKMTQQDLAARLNYSDKAVSRWEHAETLPDIETLCKICDIYGVRFEYLLVREQPKKNNPNVIKRDAPSRILTMFIAVCSVWIFATVAYISLEAVVNARLWPLFIWAIPASCVVALIYNGMFFKSNALRCVLFSLLTWSIILALYFQFLHLNIWMLFISGVPIEAVIILTAIEKAKSEKIEKRESLK